MTNFHGSIFTDLQSIFLYFRCTLKSILRDGNKKGEFLFCYSHQNALSVEHLSPFDGQQGWHCQQDEMIHWTPSVTAWSLHECWVFTFLKENWVRIQNETFFFLYSDAIIKFSKRLSRTSNFSLFYKWFFSLPIRTWTITVAWAISPNAALENELRKWKKGDCNLSSSSNPLESWENNFIKRIKDWQWGKFAFVPQQIFEEDRGRMKKWKKSVEVIRIASNTRIAS